MVIPITKTVYFVITPTPSTMLAPVHEAHSLARYDQEAVATLRTRHNNLRIVIFDLVGVTVGEREQFLEHAIRAATGQLGTEHVPRFTRLGDDYTDENDQ